jgi:hypothetical protein
MPRALLDRIGFDTLAKLEAAATRRYAEAQRLAADEPLGALYLYGYTIEMRLKAAYYRLAGVPELGHRGADPTAPVFASQGRAERHQAPFGARACRRGRSQPYGVGTIAD